MPKKTTTNKKHTIAPRRNLKSCLRKRIPRPRIRKRKVRFSLEIVLKEQLRLLSDDSNFGAAGPRGPQAPK